MSKPSGTTEPGKLSTAMRFSPDRQLLYDELRALIASSRQRLAGAVNAELTRLYWSVGERLRTEVLGGADRAKYGDRLINRVGEQLAQEFGRGFEAKNLRRMVQFAQTFPQTEIVATLSRQLSWSHFVNLLPLKTEQARQFYAQQAATNTWSVRELRHQIERKALSAPKLPVPNRQRCRPQTPSPPKSLKTRTFWTFWACAKATTKLTWKPPSCASSKPSSWSWVAALRLWSGKSAWSLTAMTSTWICFSTTAACAA